MNHMVVNAKLTDFFGKIFKIDVGDCVFQKRASKRALKSLKFFIYQRRKKKPVLVTTPAYFRLIRGGTVNRKRSPREHGNPAEFWKIVRNISVI